MPPKKPKSSRSSNDEGPFPYILIVDDNLDLLHFLSRLMTGRGWITRTADSAAGAQRLISNNPPGAAVIDYMLPDGNGVELAIEVVQSSPTVPVIVMTGTILPPEEEARCEERHIPVMRKPFLASDVMQKIRERLPADVGDGTLRKRVRVLPADAPGVDAHRALKVFFSYSHKDENLMSRLNAHLASLRHMGIIHSWHDRKITAGSDLDDAIDAQLEKADLVLLLISADFLNSDYCYKKELKHALEREKEGKVRVVPVILRPVDWERSPFSHLMAVPKDGKPITRWTNRDAGFLSAAREIRRVAEELSATIRSRR